MEINIENARAAFKIADESTKKILLALMPELEEEEAQKADNRPVTERVKTFEDACNELGNEHPFVLAYQSISQLGSNVAAENYDVTAYLKLRIICTALNEGWQPTFKEGERRWYPWFLLWTKEELSDKDDDWKADRHIISTGVYSGDYAGFAFALSIYAPSSSSSFIGSRLCLKSEALATYCGKQFISLWADFNLIKSKI